MEILKKDDFTIPPFNKQIVLTRSRKNTDWSHKYYHIKELHEKGYKGKGVKVAVLDTGVDLTHDSFKTAIKEKRLIAKDARKDKRDPIDRNGHGTWCVSRYISDGTGILGFAPECSVTSYKILNDNGSGGVENIINGIKMAIQDGCHIISTSIGWEKYHQEFNEVVENAKNNHIVWFSAAGNDGQREDIDYPGLYDDVFSVGSHNKSSKRSKFSDWGVDLDLYSSGEDVLGAYLDNQDAYLQGTSMATPSAGALFALVYHHVVEQYNYVDRKVMKNFIYCL